MTTHKDLEYWQKDSADAWDKCEERRIENGKLNALLQRVLAANIARGCQPQHPRLRLIYDIQDALYPR